MPAVSAIVCELALCCNVVFGVEEPSAHGKKKIRPEREDNQATSQVVEVYVTQAKLMFLGD